MSDMFANRYRTLAKLGQGGMGAIYRVADTLHGDRELALKLIQTPGPITPEADLRFREEFRAMAKLRHPNTLEVFEFGRLDDRTHYFTMAVVAGEELGELSRGRPMALQKVYPILIQLLQALDFIHSRLYVHRDITSANIRILADGTLKLMDFGLMSQLGLQSPGRGISGTPGYLPPEVVKGGAIDASSDLYSVGCLAFELITGRLPFQGSLMEVVRAHVSEAPPALRGLVPEAPEALERIVDRLLEKSAFRRYRRASEVIDELATLAGIDVARSNLEQRQSYLTTASLVGRDRELAVLEGSLNDAIAGRSRAVFVGAPAGVGKTRLVAELLLHAKLVDVHVLHGQCLESGMAPYEPLSRALSALVPLSSPDELALAAPALSHVVGSLRAHLPEAADARAAGAPTKQEINEAVVVWLASVASRLPLALFFDDLQWCDARSLEVFNEVIRSLGEQKLVVLATFRSDEAPPGASLWATVEEGLADYMKLEPFDTAGVSALLKSMLGEIQAPEEVGEALYAATSGNAFFVTEVLRFLMEQQQLVHRDGVWHFPLAGDGLALPTNLEATVARRLSRLSDDARLLARVASVLGRYQEREVLLAVSGMEEASLFSGLDELIERQFILRTETGYTFPHDRVREVLYEEMPEDARRDIHQRIAEFLEARQPAGTAATVAGLAHHFYRGRDRLKSYEYTLAAGQQSRGALVTAQAAKLFQQAEESLIALDRPDKAAKLEELWWIITISTLTIAPRTAVTYLERLRAADEARGEPATREGMFLRIEIFNWLAVTYGLSGRPVEGLLNARRSHELAQATGLEDFASVVRMNASIPLMVAGRYDELVALANEVGEVCRRTDFQDLPRFLIAMRGGLGIYQNMGCFQGSRPSEATLERARAAAREYGARHTEGLMLFPFALWYAWTGRLAEATEAVEEMAQVCRQVGAPLAPVALYVRPLVLAQRGEYDEALLQIARIKQLPHVQGEDFMLQLVNVLEVRCLVSLARLAEAEPLLAELELHARASGMALIVMRALLVRAELELARQGWPKARRALEEALKLSGEGPTRNPMHQAITLRLMAQLALVESLYDRADEYLLTAIGILSRADQDNPLERGHCERVVGDLYMARGRRLEAAVAWRRAGELFHNLKNRFRLHEVTQRLEGVHGAPKLAQATQSAPAEERWLYIRALTL